MYDGLLDSCAKYLIASARGNFNLNKFKSLSLTEAYDYVRHELEQLGVGSSRAVYLMSGRKVIKIALNEHGLYQNELEKKLSDKFADKDLVAKVYDSAPDARWLISEVLSPVNDSDFNNYFQYSLPGIIHISYDGDYDFGLDSPDEESNYYNLPRHTAEFIKNFRDLMIYGDLAEGDVKRLSSWGKSADGKLKILDSGFDHNLSNQYKQNIEPKSFSGFLDPMAALEDLCANIDVMCDSIEGPIGKGSDVLLGTYMKRLVPIIHNLGRDVLRSKQMVKLFLSFVDKKSAKFPNSMDLLRKLLTSGPDAEEWKKHLL